jgi:hypothetical protein
VTLEFLVIGPGNAAVSLANLVDGFTGWSTQPGLLEGVTPQSSSTPTESSAPQASNTQPGSSTLQQPSTPTESRTPRPPGTQPGSSPSQLLHIPIGGSTPQPPSTPKEGELSRLPTDQTTGMPPQPPGTRTMQQPAGSTRDSGALTSPTKKPRSTPAEEKVGKTYSPTAGQSVGSLQAAVAGKKQEVVPGSAAPHQPPRPTADLATATHGMTSGPATVNKAAGSDREEPGVRYGVNNTFSTMHALFSGAAFVGVLFIIFLQQKHLQLQKKRTQINEDRIATHYKDTRKDRKSISRTSL